MFLLSVFCCGTPPSFLKVMGWVGGGGGGLEQFSVSPRPLGFGFGTKWFGAKGLGPGLDNKTQIVKKYSEWSPLMSKVTYWSPYRKEPINSFHPIQLN